MSVEVIFRDGSVQVTLGPFEGIESNGQRLVTPDGRTVAHRTYATQSRPPMVPVSGWLIEAPFVTENPAEAGRLYGVALIRVCADAAEPSESLGVAA